MMAKGSKKRVRSEEEPSSEYEDDGFVVKDDFEIEDDSKRKKLNNNKIEKVIKPESHQKQTNTNSTLEIN
jgi:hypothetical protein